MIILWLFFVYLVVITIHEAGHFAACLLVGVPINALYLGLPVGPKLRLRLGRYPLYIFPLLSKASVKMDGEGYHRAPLWRRIVINLAGPFANLLSLGVLLIAILGPVKGFKTLKYLFALLGFGTLFLVRGQPSPSLVGISAGLSEALVTEERILGTLMNFAMGVFNLLPLPGLDGGWVVIEALVWLGLPRSWATAIPVCCAVLLLLFTVFIAFRNVPILVF